VPSRSVLLSISGRRRSLWMLSCSSMWCRPSGKVVSSAQTVQPTKQYVTMAAMARKAAHGESL
jgi:hypothetical protein